MSADRFPIRRAWAMPDSKTFNCPPLGEFVRRYLATSKVSVDPFARNKRWATYTNDLNPATAAASHMDASDFLVELAADGVTPDLYIIDPPYSPGQMAECYKIADPHHAMGLKATQNAALYSRVRGAVNQSATPGAVALWFGWNSVGQAAPWELVEMLVVCHGGAHNDTIATAWRLPEPTATLL